MSAFSGDLGLTAEDIPALQEEIGYVTEHCEVEALALCTLTGYQIVYAAAPTFDVDSDALAGLSGAMTMTSKTTIQQVFQEELEETIIRADNGYCIITKAGRFVLVGAGYNIKEMMKTSKAFRIAGRRIGKRWPDTE